MLLFPGQPSVAETGLLLQATTGAGLHFRLLRVFDGHGHFDRDAKAGQKAAWRDAGPVV